jgi:serine/threonine protein kinase
MALPKFIRRIAGKEEEGDGDVGTPNKGSPICLWQEPKTKEYFVTKRYIDYTYNMTMNTGGEKSNEYLALTQLKGHPAFPRVWDYSEEETSFAMEYGNGGDLWALCESRPITPMPERLVWHIFRDIAEGLAYMQAGWKRGDAFVKRTEWRALIHGDLTVGNVLLRWYKDKDG